MLTLVPPLPHFGGGGILCPDEVLMVPLLPHFGGGGILFLFIFIIFWEFLVPPQVADAISILFQKIQRVRGGRLVSNMVSRHRERRRNRKERGREEGRKMKCVDHMIFFYWICFQ